MMRAATPIIAKLGRFVLMLWFVSASFTLSQDLRAASSPTNQVRVLDLEGEKEKVEIARAGSAAWDPAYVNEILMPGDRGRTGPRSRALLRMSDLSVLRVKERSQFEIKQSV